MTITDVAQELRLAERLTLEPRPLSAASLSRLQDDDLALLLLIRHFEAALLELFSAGKLNGTTHTSLGQEYIPVALRTLLADEDFIFSNHRGHGHYIARFNDPAGLLAEIMGRAGAICNGVGGSQHIYRAGYCSTGVQGESLPIAAGVALHLKRANNHGLAVVYNGDGTWGEGSVYEALNIAQLWGLPLLVVVENNRIAQSTPIIHNMAGTIEGRAQAFGIAYLRLDTKDVNAIRAAAAPLIRTARRESTPLIIEFETDRLGPHSKGDDDRSADELATLHARDWHTLYREQFSEQFAAIEADAQATITQLVRDIEARPLAQWSVA